MRKEIFQAIADRIAQKVPDIKYIDLWNEQLAELQSATAFPTPSLFVEFEQFEYNQNANHVTQADIGIRIHVITRTILPAGSSLRNRIAENTLQFLDLLDEVNRALASLSGEHFSTLMHTTSATNHNHAELIESIERYVTRGLDTSAIRQAERIRLTDMEIIDRV